MEFTDHFAKPARMYAGGDSFDDYPAAPELPPTELQGFHWADYVVFVLFLVVSLGIGMAQGILQLFGCAKKEEQTTEEFLVGNRSLSVAPVSLSMLSAFLSAILILGTPAEVYVEGTEYWIYLLGMMSACVFAVLIFVPLLYPLKLTSSYEVRNLNIQEFKFICCNSEITFTSCIFVFSSSDHHYQIFYLFADKVKFEKLSINEKICE